MRALVLTRLTAEVDAKLSGWLAVLSCEWMVRRRDHHETPALHREVLQFSVGNNLSGCGVMRAVPVFSLNVWPLADSIGVRSSSLHMCFARDQSG